jgi:hypothetical protein
MQNPNPNNKTLVRCLGLLGTFGIVPALFYWLAIRPPMQRIQGFQQQVSTSEMGQPRSYFRVTSAVTAEQAVIPEFQKRLLARIPMVNDPEELIRYGVVLSDALTSEAVRLGLHVSGLEALNDLVRGQYAPARNNPSNELTRWPRLAPSLAADPLRILALDIPSLELRMTMSGNYSKVFTFVESLADFPALVNVDAVSVDNSGLGVSFRLKIRGYYFSPTKQRADSVLLKEEVGKL